MINDRISYDAGWEYAEWCFDIDGCGELIDQNTYPDIPDGDYKELEKSVENPNARDYWQGYNDKMTELIGE